MEAISAGAASIISKSMVVKGGLGLTAERFTLTRTIGQVSVSLDVSTASVEATVAVGCIAARNEAITAGTASLPSLVSDPDADWIYYTIIHVRNPNTTNLDGPISMRYLHFDVSSQRKLDAGDDLVWLAFAQTTVCSVGVAGRYLLKLA